MDRGGAGVPPLSAAGTIDLHVHSTASDGLCPPAEVVRRAHAAGLAAIALTDHDTLAGVPAAAAEGHRLGLRIVSGCEFSTVAPWGGEMHVLGYFLSPDHPDLTGFLRRCREHRVARAGQMVEALQAWGVDVSLADVEREAAGAAIGRPHVARVLVRQGTVASTDEAFGRWLGRGRRAYVEKVLPTFRDVADLVHGVGGLVAAAHLKDRATSATLTTLKSEGLAALETRHPGHTGELRARLTALAVSFELLRTGGSDWHGDPEGDGSHAMLGSEEVPAEWLDAMDRSRHSAT